MPASQFFLMKEQGQKIRARHYLDLCNIQGISITSSDYFRWITGQFQEILTPEEKPDAVPRPEIIPVNTATTEGKNAVLLFTKAFRKGKGG